MPDSDKPFRQTVQQESTDKLNGCYRKLFNPSFLSVFDFEGYHPVFEFGDTTVCNRDPVRVACQIFQNVFRLFDRIAHVNNPFFLIQPGLQLSIKGVKTI